MPEVRLRWLWFSSCLPINTVGSFILDLPGAIGFSWVAGEKMDGYLSESRLPVLFRGFFRR